MISDAHSVQSPGATSKRTTATAALAVISAVVLIALALTGSRYGYFRDELYYLACTDHLAFGYVDHPPLSIAVLWVVRHLFGDSLFAIRLVAWLAIAGTVFFTGLLARDLGAGRFGQALAALCIAVGPVYLGVGHFYSMNALDVLLWTLSAFAFERAVTSDRFGWWVVLGLVLGLGLENKISVLWLGAGVGAALVLTRARRFLLTPGPWIAAAIALSLFLPHLVWQVQHGWPTIEFMRNATSRKMTPISPLEFVVNEVVVQHPMTLPVWVAGLVFLCIGSTRSAETRPAARALFWLFAVPALILMFSGSARANYLSPAFPIAFAGGGVWLGQLFDGQPRWTHAAVVFFIGNAGIVTAPLVLPILPVERTVTYLHELKMAPRAEENTRMGPLPQHFADQFGWPELAGEVSRVYHELPTADRAVCGIFASNYGRAGAIDFFGRKLGLPPAISGHNNYFLWGPRGYTGQVMIVIGGTYADHRQHFDEVTQVAATSCRYCMPYEDGVPIFVCRGLHGSLQQVWASVKDFI
jgi:hypothetical protein